MLERLREQGGPIPGILILSSADGVKAFRVKMHNVGTHLFIIGLGDYRLVEANNRPSLHACCPRRTGETAAVGSNREAMFRQGHRFRGTGISVLLQREQPWRKCFFPGHEEGSGDAPSLTTGESCSCLPYFHPARSLSTASLSDTTSAIFAFMSNMLASWISGDRSPHASPTT